MIHHIFQLVFQEMNIILKKNGNLIFGCITFILMDDDNENKLIFWMKKSKVMKCMGMEI